MHIRIYYLISSGGFSKRLPVKQKRVIPGCQGKTPVAQMHFASELPLSLGNHIMEGQNKTSKANPGLTRKKLETSWKVNGRGAKGIGKIV